MSPGGQAEAPLGHKKVDPPISAIWRREGNGGDPAASSTSMDREFCTGRVEDSYRAKQSSTWKDSQKGDWPTW